MSISYDVPEGYDFVDGEVSVSLGQAVTEGEAVDIIFLNIEQEEGNTLTVPVAPYDVYRLAETLIEALRQIQPEGDGG